VGAGYLAALVVASVAIILTPGPSLMFVLARAIAWGRWTAYLTAIGNALGLFVVASVVAIGLGPVFSRFPAALLVVQVLGGLYLVHLGVKALRHRQELAASMLQVEESRPPWHTIVREGFMVGVLNPKSLIFFAAVFPQFIDPAGASATAQLLLFGLIFAVLCVLLDGTWGLLVGSTRDWFVTSGGRLLAMRTVGGVVMVLLGVLVLLPLAWEAVRAR